jgi:hypothetical protein
LRRTGKSLAADPPITALREGVGATDPTLWDDHAGGVVAYGDLVERARLLPLVSRTEPSPAPAPQSVDAGAPSLEPLLESGRLIAAQPASSVTFAGRFGKPLPSPSGKHAIVALAALPRAARIEARILLCER